MDHGFQAWVEAVLPPLEPDEGGDVGHRPVGLMDFLREMFDKHGPVPLEALTRDANDRQMSLTRTGAELFRADLERTTSLRPVIEVWWSREIGTPVASYNGNYTTPALSAFRASEAICEVADNLRDHVMDDLWTVWPVCPDDGFVLDPRPVEGRAQWYCRIGPHAVGPIGELPATERSARMDLMCLDCGSFNIRMARTVDPETAARMRRRFAVGNFVCADCGSRHIGQGQQDRR